MTLLGRLAAQNLIPNPGFDEVTDCPSELGQIYLAEPWEEVTIGFANLMNSCSPSEYFIKVPNAGRYIHSYQPARSGEGYAHILTYRNVAGDGNIIYAETPLLERLQKGKEYYIEFYVSPDINPDPADFWIYTDAVGLALTDTFYYEEVQPNEAMSLEPVIENRGTLITDTVGWTRISGCHISDGTEKFAIIGNFRNTAETLIEVEDENVWPYNNFFYIEDVLIMLFDPLPDTLLLCNTAEELNGSFLYGSYLWSTGETDSMITISSSGQYTLEVFMDNCVLRDTVQVIGARKESEFPTDTLICSDESLLIQPLFFGNYQWQNGRNTEQITIQRAGNYAATITNACGEFYFSTDVEVEDCLCEFYIPNIFSPNNDGINDDLEIFISCDFEYNITNFSVFDRWGDHIYTSVDEFDMKWDGTRSGKSMENGVYIWFLEYEVSRNGMKEKQIKTGDVMILR